MAKKAKKQEEGAEEVETIDHKTAVIDSIKAAIAACDSAIPANCCQKGEVLGHAIDTLKRLESGMERYL